MNHLIQTWLDARKKKEHLQDVEDDLLQLAEEKIKLPDKLRSATPKDIVVGAIIYHTNFDDGERVWNYIEEVHAPIGNFAGYTAHDGCRYGLHGAFVEVEDE